MDMISWKKCGSKPGLVGSVVHKYAGVVGSGGWVCKDVSSIPPVTED